ncbi:MAG TPA: hypothetical protein VFI14_04485 [Chryseosolibacter sp.]|jgi:hypothetical protein|nr:hypothetical protein [Chryseosolibacter sp.]
MEQPHVPVSVRVNRDAIKTILLTGISVGIIDGLAAMILTFARSGRSPVIVFQYIASGILGDAAFSDGFAATLLGVFCHFFIALTWSAVFFFLHPTISAFMKGKVEKSILYAIVIWTIMNLLVLPASAVDQGPVTASKILIGAGILVVAAGLPIAYSFDRHYGLRRGKESRK